MRRTVQIVELIQPRCDLRFGVGDCTATGTPKCYQTWQTCKAKTVFNRDGFVRWRFCRAGDPIGRIYEQDGADDIATNAYPVLLSVSTQPTRINVGSSRSGESPFGLRATVSVELSDFRFQNEVGDFYADERTVKASFAGLFLARLGEAASQLTLNVYNGYAGETLAEMQVSRFDVDAITGPSGGRWQITGADPLSRASAKRATFPRSTDIRLNEALSEDADDLDVVVSATVEADLSDAFGNTAISYLRIGSEILSYTGYTDDGEGIWTLGGVIRGALNTQIGAHEIDAGCQRVGHYSNIQPYEAAKDLLVNHSGFPIGLIPTDQWDEEGATYLSTLRVTGTVSEPTAVEALIGELSRDGMFSTWWDERGQVIPLLAVRPPSGTPDTLSDRSHIVAISFEKSPDDRITRSVVFYDQVDPTKTLDDYTNYRSQRIRIDTEAEADEYADASIRERRIFSRWIRTDANSLLLGASLLFRYRVTPEYATLTLDGKDRSIAVGDVLDLETADVIDASGSARVTRWQVIEAEETTPGHSVRFVLQSYEFVGRFGFWMDTGAPDYDAATDEEKDEGMFWADNDSLMPGGDDPYRWR